MSGVLLVMAAGVAAAVEELPAIAVLDFKAINAPQGDAEAISGFVRNAVVNSGAYTVVEKQNIERILAEQAFQQTGCTDADCAVKLGKILNVQKMMVGSYTIFEGNRVISARIVDVETGKVDKAETQKIADPSQIDVGISFLVTRLTAGAGKAARPSSDAGGPDAPQVKSYDEIPVFDPLHPEGAEFRAWKDGIGVLVFSVKEVRKEQAAMEWAVWTRDMTAMALLEQQAGRLVRIQAGCNVRKPLIGKGRLAPSCGTKYSRLAKVDYVVGGALSKNPTGGPMLAELYMLGRDGTLVSRSTGECDQAGIRKAVRELMKNRRKW